MQACAMNNPPANLQNRLQAGDPRAAEEVFHRFSNDLIRLARERLSSKMHGRVDAEDVVQSAYRSFFRTSAAGGYSFERWREVWLLLVAITMNKLRDQVKRHQAEKRSVALEQHFGSEDSLLGLRAASLAREPSPVEALTLVDEVEQLLRPLEPLERRMVELRLQGNQLREIATATQRSVPTVRRLLDRIKEQLRQRHQDLFAR
jgi:RNA polymerase sigma-70 factor (ECF subfamily)